MANEEGVEVSTPKNEDNQTVDSAKTEMTPEPQEDTSSSASGEQSNMAGLLEDARAKADEHWNQLLRANAELENSKRRARQDIENAHKYALEKFVQELLPVKDSLEMGLAAADNSSGQEGTNALKEGIVLTLKMFETALEKFSVQMLDPLGEAFDPSSHQAMTLQESTEHAPNTVIAVMQKGYRLNDRLIRPAMVVVSKAIAAPAGEMPPAGSQIDEQA